MSKVKRIYARALDFLSDVSTTGRVRCVHFNTFPEKQRHLLKEELIAAGHDESDTNKEYSVQPNY